MKTGNSKSVSVAPDRWVVLTTIAGVLMCTDTSGPPRVFAEEVSQADATNVVFVDSPRPLYDLAYKFSAESQVPVGYEDFRFAASSDLRQVLPIPFAVVPANVERRFVYNQANSLKERLKDIVAQHNAGNRGGQYTVEEAAGFFSLVPIRCLDREGKMSDHHSPLSRNVKFAVPEGSSCLSVLEMLVERVNTAEPTGSVVLGRYPQGLLEGIDFPNPVVDATARETINKILGLMNQHQSGRGCLNWSLRYSGPNSKQKEYWFFSYYIAKPKAAAAYSMKIEAERPVAQAVQFIQKYYGCQISYEDPSLLCSCDVIGEIGSAKAGGLAGGLVELEWEQQHDNPDAILEALMKTPIEPRDPPRMFAYKKTAPNEFHVFPIKVRNKRGELIGTSSLLAQGPTTVTVDGTVAGAISEAVKLATGGDEVLVRAENSKVGAMLDLPFSSRSYNNLLPCRQVNAILQRADDNLAWRLEFNPSSGEHEVFVFTR